MNRILGSLSVAIISTGVATDAVAQARAGAIDVTATLRSPNSVRVEERYTLGPSAASIELKALTRPCVVIENMRIERDDVALAIAEVRNGPWITWRDTSPPGGDSSRLFVRYDAWLGGSGAVPLVHLASPLAGEPSRQGAVTVAVRFAGSAGRVAFPHMTRAVPTASTERADSTPPEGALGAGSRNRTRQAPNVWSGRYIAAPSFVKVNSGNKGCDRRLLPPLADGGLAWRFDQPQEPWLDR